MSLFNNKYKAMSVILQSAPVCHVELTSFDADTGEIVNVDLVDVSVTNITVSTNQLRENRHYNVTVTNSNLVGQVATSSVVIS